ncbi:helix-turn-helix domain-containing protein [Sulfoacidibacillus thermotolerans]|nr:helix-turn-helix domain-containing protein [Sulfoacidibacillus thermotolerans]
MERSYSISDVAERIGVSQGTIRNWEKELVEFLAIARDENGCRIYTESIVARLEKVNQLRAQGLSLAMIREVFATFYQVAGANDAQESKMENEATQWEAISQQLALQLESMAQRQSQEIRDYIDQRLQSMSYVQNEILSQMQQARPLRMKRRSLFARVFSL